MKMGSGAMTITPAHSMVDFDLAQKYGFEIIQIINEQGKITDKGGPDFQGLTTLEAREKLVKRLDKLGLLERIDTEYVHNLSVCYRCSTPVEPLVSEQWFVDVNKKVRGKSLKQRALDVVKNGKIEILPDRFNKTYFHWMENLRDWCISLQIWWGHRIPVWTCACGEQIIHVNDPSKCPKCKHTKLKQDPDTLDTWFSSGLWTFSTLGWPKKTKDLERFHPTSVLETGYEYGSGMESFQVLGFFWPAECGKGPESGGKPRVERVRVLLEFGVLALGAFARVVDVNDLLAARASPHRNPMAPPDLEGDAPVAQIFHPMKVGFVEAVRQDFDFAVFDHVEGALFEGFAAHFFVHIHKPLFGHERFPPR